MRRRVNASIRVGKGFDVEVEAMVAGDDARGGPERIVEGDIIVWHRSGRAIELADRYESKAVDALLDADAREEDDDER